MAEALDYAIVGGGAAAATAAEAIRGRDAAGSVAIFAREWAPPYQRPPLSKEFLQNRGALSDALMFPASWYREHDVELFVGVEVERVDPARNTLEMPGGSITYGRLLLATGASPRTLVFPGSDLDGVCTLRTYLDAERLRGMRSAARRIVVVGSGFIGMEVAASLRSGGSEVTVVTIDPGLYARFGREVSEYARALFDRHGVEVLLETSVAAIEGNDRVAAVTLTSGRSVEADAVVIGVGAKPDVALATSAGLRIEDGIVVDDRLRTSAAAVYAAGDAARFPGLDGRLVRVEHFDHAYASGAAAGANMAGADEPYRYVPLFWSDVFELSFEFVGDPAPTSAIVEGTTASGSFVVEYRDGERLCGALLARRSADERDGYRERISAG